MSQTQAKPTDQRDGAESSDYSKISRLSKSQYDLGRAKKDVDAPKSADKKKSGDDLMHSVEFNQKRLTTSKTVKSPLTPSTATKLKEKKLGGQTNEKSSLLDRMNSALQETIQRQR